ncbi:uncharacterized protein LOC124278514 [Haliotis rubra]|uniref:uncharacterized protein LOC124278514 n=1 Tax=Haliotis rubra TaxID=36100 RepID=UPI001EE5D03A|nr:uncharacterized protein LOC124278514 [Haliotis rubra]
MSLVQVMRWTLYVLLSPASVHSSPSGWFTFFSEPMSWNEAFTVCSDREERLLHVNSVHKQVDMTDTINKLANQGHLTGPLWLGAFRTLGPPPTTLWTDCSPAQLSPWQNVSYTRDRLCGEVHDDTFSWQSCNVHHQFICETHPDQCWYDKTSDHDLASGKGHTGKKVSSAACGNYCMTFELQTVNFDFLCAAYSFNKVTLDCFIDMKSDLYDPGLSPSLTANPEMEVNVKRCFRLNISSSSAARLDSRLLPENPCTTHVVLASTTYTSISSSDDISDVTQSASAAAHVSILVTPVPDLSAVSTVGARVDITTAVSVAETTVQGLTTVPIVDNSNFMSHESESSDISPNFTPVFQSDNFGHSLYSNAAHALMTSSRYQSLSSASTAQHVTGTPSPSEPASVSRVTQGTTKLPPLSLGDSALITSAPSRQDVITHRLAATTASAVAVTVVTNNPPGTRLCTCHCRPSNNTEERLQSIKQHLTVDRANLSATRRRLKSAPDQRKSVMAVGSISVGVLAVLLLVLAVLDVDQVLRLVTRCQYGVPSSETGMCTGSGQTTNLPVKDGREEVQ